MPVLVHARGRLEATRFDLVLSRAAATAGRLHAAGLALVGVLLVGGAVA